MRNIEKSSAVAILMGSKSDLPNVESAFRIMKDFEVPFTVKICSAHRTPDDAVSFAREASQKGIKVIICAVGMAVHLGGVIASNTILPVIGLPMVCPPFNGLDALLSTVQMPPGIPVAAVTTGPAGAKNAALLAVEILALSDEKLAMKLRSFRGEQALQVNLADKMLQEELESENRKTAKKP